MKIKYKTKVKDSSRYSCDRYLTTYEALEKEFCCAKMEEAFKEGFIIFGEKDSSLNQDNYINILKCFPYPEGTSWDEMPLKFCPFCAKKIETIEIERVKTIIEKKEVTQIINEELEIPIKEGRIK